MSRRVNDAEQEFGSDSFLDIIANIVGILIILIVVAGVKVARQARFPDVAPVAAVAELDEQQLDALPVADGSTQWPWQDAEDAVVADTATEPQEEEAEEPEFSLEQAIASLDEPPEDPSVVLERQIEELTLDLQQTKDTNASSEEELKKLLAAMQQEEQDAVLEELRISGIDQQTEKVGDRVFELQQLVMEADEQTAAFRSTLASLSKRQSYVTDALELVSMETQKLREVLDAKPEPVEGERLNHRLSPVGEEVVDGELHFRLHRGRIAHVPLTALLEQLKTQVSSRRSVVMRFHRYEGLVGPVEGFRMQYIVQRKAVSPLESLRHGQSAFHVSVARWSIIPAETLEAEPVEAAVRIGSRFRQLLESTDPDTAVTIWLYPDDFQYFHQLRELAHGLNLRVAARPLPEGTDIAGSPNGSRSSSQ